MGLSVEKLLNRWMTLICTKLQDYPWRQIEDQMILKLKK